MYIFKERLFWILFSVFGVLISQKNLADAQDIGSFLAGLLGSAEVPANHTQKTSHPPCPGECVHAITSVLCSKIIDELYCGASYLRCCVASDFSFGTVVETSAPLHDEEDSPVQGSDYDIYIVTTESGNNLVSNAAGKHTVSPDEKPIESSSTVSPFVTDVKLDKRPCSGICVEATYVRYCGTIIREEVCDEGFGCCATSNLQPPPAPSPTSISVNKTRPPQVAQALPSNKVEAVSHPDQGESNAATDFPATEIAMTTSPGPSCPGSCIAPLFSLLCDVVKDEYHCPNEGRCCVPEEEHTTTTEPPIIECPGACIPAFLSGMCNKPAELLINTDCDQNFMCCYDPGYTGVTSLLGPQRPAVEGELYLPPDKRPNQPHLSRPPLPSHPSLMHRPPYPNKPQLIPVPRPPPLTTNQHGYQSHINSPNLGQPNIPMMHGHQQKNEIHANGPYIPIIMPVDQSSQDKIIKQTGRPPQDNFRPGDIIRAPLRPPFDSHGSHSPEHYQQSGNQRPLKVHLTQGTVSNVHNRPTYGSGPVEGSEVASPSHEPSNSLPPKRMHEPSKQGYTNTQQVFSVPQPNQPPQNVHLVPLPENNNIISKPHTDEKNNVHGVESAHSSVMQPLDSKVTSAPHPISHISVAFSPVNEDPQRKPNPSLPQVAPSKTKQQSFLTPVAETELTKLGSSASDTVPKFEKYPMQTDNPFNSVVTSEASTFVVRPLLRPASQDVPICPGPCIASFLKFTCFGNNAVYNGFACMKAGTMCCAPVDDIEKYEENLKLADPMSVNRKPDVPTETTKNHPYVCGKKSRKRAETPRVVGGRTTTAGEYCWQVALINEKNEYLCGGALIANKYVLTAAHCITSSVRNGDPIFVRVGDFDLASQFGSPGAQTLKVSASYIHHNHNSQTLDNDIALLRMENPASINNNVCLVCLPARGATNEPGKRCIVTGYGYESENGPIALKIREAELPIVPDKLCVEQVNNVTEKLFILPTGSFCAGGEPGNDACQGDGGGPLVCENEGFYDLIGIVSWGFGCGKADVPGVYVKVATYIGWINQIISVHN